MLTQIASEVLRYCYVVVISRYLSDLLCHCIINRLMFVILRKYIFGLYKILREQIENSSMFLTRS